MEKQTIHVSIGPIWFQELGLGLVLGNVSFGQVFVAGDPKPAEDWSPVELQDFDNLLVVNDVNLQEQLAQRANLSRGANAMVNPSRTRAP